MRRGQERQSLAETGKMKEGGKEGWSFRAERPVGVAGAGPRLGEGKVRGRDGSLFEPTVKG